MSGSKHPPLHDPLGPSPQLRVGRPISPWKRHWIAHGTKWIVAGIVVAGMAGVALVLWAVFASAEHYAATPSVARVVPRGPMATATMDTRVRGPLQVDITVGSLEAGERTIVTRDLAAILKRRLDERSIEMVAAARERLTLFYDEAPGRSVDVWKNSSDGRPASVNSMRPVRISLRLVLDRPEKPPAVLGESTSGYGENAVELEAGESATRLNRLRRRLYQQSYQDALSFLRQVPLPQLSTN